MVGNLVITASDNRSLMIESSYFEFNNIEINGDSLSAESIYEGRGVAIYKSKVYGNTLNINNKRIALWAYNSSDVSIYNLQGSNNEYGMTCSGGSKIITNKYSLESKTSFVDLEQTSIIAGGINNDLTRYLVEGDDLNLLLTPGTRYVSKTGDITKTILNIPTNLGYSFVIEVKNKLKIVQ